MADIARLVLCVYGDLLRRMNISLYIGPWRRRRGWRMRCAPLLWRARACSPAGVWRIQSRSLIYPQTLHNGLRSRRAFLL
jgi:hypothetical protein